MRSVALIFPALLLLGAGHSSLAQRSEVGFGVGTFNYTGDITRNYNILNSKPGAMVFYRANLSKVMTFRTAATLGRLGASDARKPIDPAAAQRNASFDLFLFEPSMTMEYHFLDWKDPKRKNLRFTPYLFAGFALFGMAGIESKTEEFSNVQVAVPFGGGFKYNLHPKFYLGFEFGIRKTFFDYLDNISAGDQSVKDYQYGNRYDNDNYFFAGLTVTRTFYVIPCPTNPYK
jgi:hypothetical protein